MYSIDITLQYSPIPVSVQRKEAEDAQSVYTEITKALTSETPKLVELTCEKEPEKKVAFLSNQISAVIMSQKTGGVASGRTPGFFAAVAE
jgi:phage-related protein